MGVTVEFGHYTGVCNQCVKNAACKANRKLLFENQSCSVIAR